MPKEVQAKQRISYDVTGRTAATPRTRNSHSVYNEQSHIRPTQSLDLPVNGARYHRNVRGTTPLPDLTSNDGFTPFMPFQGFEAYAAKPKRQLRKSESTNSVKSNRQVKIKCIFRLKLSYNLILHKKGLPEKTVSRKCQKPLFGF